MCDAGSIPLGEAPYKLSGPGAQEVEAADTGQAIEILWYPQCAEFAVQPVLPIPRIDAPSEALLKPHLVSSRNVPYLISVGRMYKGLSR